MQFEKAKIEQATIYIINSTLLLCLTALTGERLMSPPITINTTKHNIRKQGHIIHNVRKKNEMTSTLHKSNTVKNSFLEEGSQCNHDTAYHYETQGRYVHIPSKSISNI